MRINTLNLYVFKNYISTKEVQRKQQLHAATTTGYEDRLQHGLLFKFVVYNVDLSLQN